MRLRAFVTSSALLIGAYASAWNGTGHMVIAALAQTKLTPKAKSEIDRLLKVGATSPSMSDFIAVAPWADQIRNQRSETGPWHYKDFFFRADGKKPHNEPDAVNAVSEINRLMVIVSDKSKPDTERADALRFVIHLVGDIHQPLHATARETGALPKGDRGGNDFLIKSPFGERGPRNLHSLWDQGCGLFPYPVLQDAGPDAAKAEAMALATLIAPKDAGKVDESDPDKWAKESFGEAKRSVYSTPEGQVPSDAYLAKGRALSAKRAALAGYRLAAILNKALGN